LKNNHGLIRISFYGSNNDLEMFISVTFLLCDMTVGFAN